MGALGFLGVEYDEKYGGAGADFLTTAVLCEEMARSRCASLAMAVGVHTDMASPHLYWTGSEALKEKYLPGDLPGRGAHRHRGDRAGRRLRRGRHPDPRGARRRPLRARTAPRCSSPTACMADLYFVAARIETGDRRTSGIAGISMFLVERNTPGLHGEPQARQDGQPRLRHRRARLRGHAGAGREPPGRARARASTRSCASSSGSAWWPGLHAVAGCERALEDTIAYVQQRHAFDGPLSDKQVVRHKLADLATLIEAGPLAHLRRLPQVPGPARRR